MPCIWNFPFLVLNQSLLHFNELGLTLNGSHNKGQKYGNEENHTYIIYTAQKPPTKKTYSSSDRRSRQTVDAHATSDFSFPSARFPYVIKGDRVMLEMRRVAESVNSGWMHWRKQYH
jgi:hypothetical protein